MSTPTPAMTYRLLNHNTVPCSPNTGMKSRAERAEPRMAPVVLAA